MRSTSSTTRDGPGTTADTAVRPPVQQRVWTDLLGADDRRADRPAADPTAGQRLRRLVTGRLTDTLAAVPRGTTVWLNDTAMAALACEGRYLDHLGEPFSWSVATVAGAVTQQALAIDIDSGRRLPLAEVIDCAWQQALAAGTSAGAYLAGLDPSRRAAVRATATARCAAFRDCFPCLPSWLHPRVAAATTWRLSSEVVVKVVPDLTVGRPDARHRLLGLVDLKTGGRLDTHADERRLRALLTTVKYGVAPWRVASYYLDEGQWDADTVTEGYLAGAAEQLVARVQTAVRLTLDPPKPAHLRLQAGPACNWCARAPDCPLGGRAAPVRLTAA